MPAAAAIPSIIGAGTSIVSGILGSNAASKASQQQAQSQQRVIDTTNQAVSSGQAGVATGTTNANDILSRSAQTQLGIYQPYIGAGQGTLSQLAQLTGADSPLTKQFNFNPSDLQSDPGYQFTLQQGQQAIQRAAAAQGGLFSSGTLKSLAGYTTGTANQYFNDAYNRALNTFTTNRSSALSQIGSLQNLAGLGLSAGQLGGQAVGSTSQQQAQNAFGQGTFNAGLGLQGAGIIGGALTNQGNAQAAGTVGSANNLLQGFGGAANQIGQFLTLRNLANSGSMPAGYTQPSLSQMGYGG